MADVCEKHGVTPEQIKGDSQSAPIVRARHHLMHMCFESGLSMNAIANGMGWHHTTVSYGIAKHKERTGI